MLPPVTIIIIIRGVTEETLMVEEVTTVVEDLDDKNKLTLPPIPIQSFAITAVILDIQLQNVQNLNSQPEYLAHVQANQHEGMLPFPQQIPTHKATKQHQL
jgi:hypothetical protein